MRDGRVVTCGVVLYELVQGIKHPAEEAALLNAFSAVPILELSTELWIEAGGLSAKLRTQGHTLPLSDLLIAVLAIGLGPGWLAILLCTWAPLVALARVAMGVHYASDILAGGILGVVAGVAALQIHALL